MYVYGQVKVLKTEYLDLYCIRKFFVHKAMRVWLVICGHAVESYYYGLIK